MRILVVDDELDIGAIVTRYLDRMLELQARYVFETSPHAVVARIRAGEQFDLIISDIDMPEMTGARTPGKPPERRLLTRISIHQRQEPFRPP